MYQQPTYWFHKECIRPNIFSPLTVEVITLNASLHFYGRTTEAMKEKRKKPSKTKKQVYGISFIMTQLEDRHSFSENKRNFKELLPASSFGSLGQLWIRKQPLALGLWRQGCHSRLWQGAPALSGHVCFIWCFWDLSSGPK